MSQHQNENRNETIIGSFIMMVVITGFAGGIIWGFIAQAAYFFNFLDISPKFILTSWNGAKWVYGWLGVVISVLLLSLFSIVAALIYYALMRRIKSVIGGVIYGLLLWAITMIVFPPVFPDMPVLSKMNNITIITGICIYIVYGVFIGYSISFEYSERERIKEVDASE
ncbi:YqhR family membrane protein [Peribacillus saganii]|uniref:YqhR family membrane protein n=1 Tax=Peribacillus saganii TaxID=2303992 RepID=UPI001F23F4CB|nr:YqhR family membrane protein [Peribacillus saganii]